MPSHPIDSHAGDTSVTITSEGEMNILPQEGLTKSPPRKRLQGFLVEKDESIASRVDDAERSKQVHENSGSGRLYICFTFQMT